MEYCIVKYSAKADILNNLFKSVFTQEKVAPTHTLAGPHYPSISPLHISTEGVKKLLRDLKTNKASGLDDMSARILKELANELAPVISAFFVQSLNTGSLPSDWTMAHVSPIYKKGSRVLPENYITVSLTCILCKVMEHITCKHIAKHTNEHNILTPFQHGFQQARSCETQ